MTLQRKRNPLIALLLAVIASPVVALLYVGRGRRALIYLALTVVAIPVTVLISGIGYWPDIVNWQSPIYGLWIVGTIDSFLIADKLKGEFSGPWYSRWYGLIGVWLLCISLLVIIRSFLVESFRIPSGAMMPTVLVGDYILVNKYQYGVRLPLTGYKIVDVGQPKRGDVMVFRYPADPSLDHVKRVIGLPGDTISYRQKRLQINGKSIAVKQQGEYNYIESDINFVSTQRFKEKLGDRMHEILIQPETPSVHLSGVRPFPFRENCTYDDTGFTCAVPQGNFFVLGDNRDSSSDSRYWGFVPEANILGKVFFVWGRKKH